MDPLSALGAAASAVQFVDFAWRTITGSIELYKSAEGVTKQQQVLLHITQSLRRLNNSLIDSAQKQSQKCHPSNPQSDLAKLLTECSSVAEDIIIVLGSTISSWVRRNTVVSGTVFDNTFEVNGHNPSLKSWRLGSMPLDSRSPCTSW